MVKKFQYGYKVPTKTWGDIGDFFNKGAEVALKVLEPVGKVISSVISNLPLGGASAVLPQQSPKNFLQAKQREKIFEEKVVPVLSPTNHVVAWTQGSLNPAVGLKKIAEWGPAALLGSFVTDIAALKYVPKVMKNTPTIVDKALAATGNKGANGRVIAREINNTAKEGLRTSPIERDRYYFDNGKLESFRDYEGTGSQMLESSFLDEKLNSGDPNTLVHFDRGDHKPNYWVYNLDGSKVKGAYVQEGKLVNPNKNGLYWYPGKPFQDIHWEHLPYFRFNVPTRYISVNRKSGKFNDKYIDYADGTRLLEVISEGPVDLSNASVILKDPLGWWGKVKYTTSSPLQVTHPWQLSNSKYSRFQLSNGKIRLLLPSHTEAKPRQFVLEPQGDNKYYVHMKVWDDVDKKVPATMSSADKNALFEALYNELPDGAEILFPKSGPGNYATRGTVAGLQHLSRDSRFTPGTKGTLLYTDKDGKTVKTYEGTSFIKRGEDLYSREPVIRGKDYEDYVTRLGDEFLNHGAKVKHIEPDPELTKMANRVEFTPIFLMWPGARLRAHSKEIIRRLQLQGMDVDKEIASLPMVGYGTVREVINKNALLPSLIGYFHKTGVTGMYNKRTGITLVDPTEHNKTVSTMLHERNMHGTERILTPKMWNPYDRFLSNMFGHGNVNMREINNKRHYSIIDPENASLEHPITGGALKREELRATLGLYRKNLYDDVAYSRAKADGIDIPSDDLEPLRSYFEAAVDELNLPQVKMDLSAINGYGRAYAKHGPKWHPNFLEDLKELLKYSPGILPFMRNEKE